MITITLPLETTVEQAQAVRRFAEQGYKPHQVEIVGGKSIKVTGVLMPLTVRHSLEMKITNLLESA